MDDRTSRTMILVPGSWTPRAVIAVLAILGVAWDVVSRCSSWRKGGEAKRNVARREWYRRGAAATTLSKDALVAILLIWAPFIAVGLVIDLAMAVPAIGTLVALCVVIVIVIDAVIRYSVQRPSLTTGH